MSPRIDWSSADALSRSPIMPYDMPSGSTLTLGPGLGTIFPVPKEFPELMTCPYCGQLVARDPGGCVCCGGRLSE